MMEILNQRGQWIKIRLDNGLYGRILAKELQKFINKTY